jgi:hypothetical protein
MKTKFLLTAFLVCLSHYLFAQIYVTQNANVDFFSDGIIEDIKAINKKSTGLVDVNAKTFLFKITIKDFAFENELMQEHFNEKYLESDKYPSANFKGKIVNDFDISKDGEYQVNAVGDLNIHGINQPRTIPVTVKVQNGKVSLQSKFMVKMIDHKITIPSIMFEKIAEQVTVTISSDLIKK